MDTPQYQSSSTLYDAAFQKVQGLTWLPWVGQHYSERPPNQRLLVVGESYYYTGDTPEHTREAWLNNRQATREVAFEDLVNHQNGNKTLDAIPKLLFKTNKIDEIDCPRLWGDSAYYNFVQRPMDHTPGQCETPKVDDFVAGRKVFEEIVRIIQPSHCLFIGVTAANYFIGVTRHEKIDGVWPRFAKLEIAGTTTELIFVHHLSRCKNLSQWHDYLQTQHTDFMKWLGAQSLMQTAETLTVTAGSTTATTPPKAA
jgi:hypothetical protein